MNYNISGIVVRGDGYGRKIGFPTVNLDLDEEKQREFPADGVYSGTVMLEGKEYRAGIVIGPDEKIEAHLIGYSGDAYGAYITFKLEKFIREFKKFATEEELIEQIRKDLLKCSQA